MNKLSMSVFSREMSQPACHFNCMSLKKKNKVTFLKAASITPFTEKEKNAKEKWKLEYY